MTLYEVEFDEDTHMIISKYNPDTVEHKDKVWFTCEEAKKFHSELGRAIEACGKWQSEK